MKKVVPDNAHLIPPEAKCVFKGQIYDVYQWGQKLFDGSSATFEMLKRPDVASVIAIKDDKIVIVKQLQPNWPKARFTLPGGRADESEAPLETAKRETLEETGMTFKNWKLLDVIQNHEKIEYFIYIYLASSFESQTEIHADAGEQIEVELLDFKAVKELSKSEPRLAEASFARFDSLQEILAAPEFKGRTIE